MSTVGWLLVVAVGIALGFSAGRLWPGSAARVTALEKERNEAREDLQNYRQEVSQHFERTAELFDKVTTDYRDLYEHLARSERQLGAFRGESAASSLAQPEQRRLAANSAASAAAASPAAQDATAESAATPTEETIPAAAEEEASSVEEDRTPHDKVASPAEEDTLPAENAASPDDETAADEVDENNATRRGQ